MMQIYKIDGINVQVICCPPEDINKGDYILVEDLATAKALIIQVVNSGYANVPGILEDILRASSTEKVEGVDLDPLEMRSFVNIIKDAELLTCKIRGAIDRGKLSNDVNWIPSRSTSRLRKLPDKDLIKLAGIGQEDAVDIGVSKGGGKISINISSIDGKMNIITGKKETGKSHLSKLLLLRLVSCGGICIVFDVNGEYVNLGYTKGERKTALHDKFIPLTPGKDFKVSLQYAGPGVLLRVMESVLDLPATSAWEFRRIWNELRARGALRLEYMRSAIRAVSNNYIQDALLRRFESLISTNFFTDDVEKATTLDKVLEKVSGGGAIIVNLQNMTSKFRQIVVEFMLSKLSQLLEDWFLRAVFLFAEEAHLYLRETYWDDIVTRMRHLGVFTTFITNQPDSISESVYRQADNIFLFNFTNEHDLEIVSKASRVDVETVNVIARQLPLHHCLMLGKVLNDFPMIVRIDSLDEETMGETRLFFANPKQK